MSDFRIDPISTQQVQRAGKVKPKGGNGFGEVISQAVDKVGKLENEADKSIVNMLQGKADIHQTMVALQKSDLSMRLFLAVRNKAIEAYREVMRMQF
jgi:flagellar hook-basal body complex protein FliE